MMGYPVDFEDGATGQGGRPVPESIRVMVDSNTTKRKVNQINSLTHPYPITNILHNVGDGQPTTLYRLIAGEEIRTSPGINFNSVLTEELQPSIESCFMRAHDTAQARSEAIAKSHNMKRHFDQFDIKQQQLYDKLKEKGIRPIEPEQMAGMMMSVVRDILEKNPDLKPDSPKNTQDPLN